jgi:capsule polysaccharide export protein KpsE/RkpR
MNDSFQDQENKKNSRVDDENSLKEIIFKIQEWWSIVWSVKLLILSLSLILGLSSALYTKFLMKPIYTASYQLFFQEESGGFNSAMRLASSFGIGGIGGGGASSSATVQEFITSRNNIAHAMNEDLVGGRLVDRYHAEAMEDDDEFALEYRANFNVNRRYTDSLLTQAFLALNEDALDLSFDEKTGVLNFRVTTDNELFTHDLATNLVQNTEAQFKDWKRQKTQNNVLAFQEKVDSLELALDLCLRNLGEYQDQNNSLVYALDKMEQMRLTIDLESLKIAYGEYIKALEMSKAELMNLEGPFKYFDEPIFPLEKTEASAAKAGVLGSVITGFLLVLFFIGRVEAGKIMAD